MIVIEPGRPGDLDALLAIENEAFQSDRIKKETFKRYLRDNMGSAPLLVGIDDETREVFGYILLWTCKTHTTARINSYAVSAKARGSGLGERLIEAACVLAANGYNCSMIRTEVRVDNPHALRRYEKSGFRRYGSKEKYYSDGCAAFSYERPIVIIRT